MTPPRVGRIVDLELSGIRLKEDVDHIFERKAGSFQLNLGFL